MKMVFNYFTLVELLQISGTILCTSEAFHWFKWVKLDENLIMFLYLQQGISSLGSGGMIWGLRSWFMENILFSLMQGSRLIKVKNCREQQSSYKANLNSQQTVSTVSYRIWTHGKKTDQNYDVTMVALWSVCSSSKFEYRWAMISPYYGHLCN